jgi:hypothetical protein
MHSDSRLQHRRTAVFALFLAVALCACAGLVPLLYRVYQAAAYPGATQIADETITHYTPNFSMRRTTVYRSADPFNKIYNWYSVKFDLGPESYAQSNCILMAKSVTTGWVFDEQMSVMLCHTPNDQMMFVMRSLLVRYPHW